MTIEYAALAIILFIYCPGLLVASGMVSTYRRHEVTAIKKCLIVLFWPVCALYAFGKDMA